MTKTVWEYGIKFKYGYSKEYGPGFHTGEDWTVVDGRKDILVTVNGATIGIAGTTGLSTGIHTHVGKWLGGQVFPPKGAGKTIPGGVVTQIDTTGNTNNGKFVRVKGSDGYDYVYLHLSKVLVKVGQKLKASAPPKPKPIYPKFVRVSSKGGAYVRRRPTTASSLAGSRYLPYGTPFRVKGAVKGQKIANNDKWYVSMYGNYIWSGNVK